MATRILLLLLIVLPLQAEAQSTFDGGTFSLTLDDHWAQIDYDKSQNQYTFVSRQPDARLRISGLEIKVKPGTIDKLASATLLFVVDRELRLHSQGRGVIERQWAFPIDGGRQINYFGHDSSRRFFRYAGVVFEHKVIGVYLETRVDSEREREALFASVITGLSY